MLCLEVPFPKNCITCPLNFENLCVGSSYVDGNNTYNYRQIDTEFQEGVNSRPEWCPAKDSEEIVESVSKLIDKATFRKLGKVSKENERMQI